MKRILKDLILYQLYPIYLQLYTLDTRLRSTDNYSRKIPKIQKWIDRPQIFGHHYGIGFSLKLKKNKRVLMAQLINLCVPYRQSRATLWRASQEVCKTHPIVGGIVPQIKTFDEQLRFKLN